MILNIAGGIALFFCLISIPTSFIYSIVGDTDKARANEYQAIGWLIACALCWK